MSATSKLTRMQLRDVVRSRWVIGYAAFFAGITEVLLRFGSEAKTALSLMNVVLLLVPLVAVVFATMYLYHAREFTELVLAQPIRRRSLFAAQYLGLALPLSAALAIGIAIPAGLHGVGAGGGTTLAVVALCGVVLTFVFTAIATVIVGRVEDRVKGLGAAIAAWLACSVLYDGLVLAGLMIFADYPLERPALIAMIANPIDLARLLVLMRLDVSALLGYTGAVFERFFGTAGGATIATLALATWAAVPFLLGLRRFGRKDF
jgi:Cu-processing system permease protein